jgi:hypothetical protein
LFEDPEDLGAHGIRIPVRMWRSDPALDEPPPPLIPDFGWAQKPAIVALIDAEWLARDDWVGFMDELQAAAAATSGAVLPVAMIDAVLDVKSPLLEENAIRLADLDDNIRGQVLLNRVAHALCRLVDDTADPVRVFISHSKRDGLEIAAKVRTFLQSGTGVHDFFDTQDLVEGARWRDVIRNEAGNNVLLVIRTDAYATREWCRTEVLDAKTGGSPVVVLDALDDRETRGFPYLGNTPSVRWRPEVTRESMEDLLGVILEETLRFRYFPRRVEALCEAYEFGAPQRTLPAPPELLTALRLNRADNGGPQLVVYPDPPLGTDELALVREVAPQVSLITANELVARG